MIMYALKIMDLMSRDEEFNFKGITLKLKGDNPKVTETKLLSLYSYMVGTIAMELAKTNLGTAKLEVILDDDNVYTGSVSRLIGKSIYIGLKMKEFLSKIEPLYKIIRKSRFLNTLFYTSLYTFYLRTHLTAIEQDVFSKKIASIIADNQKPDSREIRDLIFDEKLKEIKRKPSGADD